MRRGMMPINSIKCMNGIINEKLIEIGTPRWRRDTAVASFGTGGIGAQWAALGPRRGASLRPRQSDARVFGPVTVEEV